MCVAARRTSTCLARSHPLTVSRPTAGWITASQQSSFDKKWCTVQSDIPNPDTAPVQRAPPGVTYPPPPLLTGPIINPAPPSGVGVPGTSASIPTLYIVLALAVVACGGCCWWRRRRRRAARTRNRKRRRSQYTRASRGSDGSSSQASDGYGGGVEPEVDVYVDEDAEDEVAQKRQKRKEREASSERKQSRVKSHARVKPAEASKPPAKRRPHDRAEERKGKANRVEKVKVQAHRSRTAADELGQSNRATKEKDLDRERRSRSKSHRPAPSKEANGGFRASGSFHGL